MIRTEDGDRTRRIVIDRPDRANALTREMLADLLSAIRTADPAAVLVLTGTGKTFSAGGDLQAIARGDLAQAPEWDAIPRALALHPCLSVAALNGTVAGGALGLILGCDLRVAVPEAAFFYPVLKRGLLPPASHPGLLRALVGPARARLILLGGARLTAEEALRIGLIDRIAEGSDLAGTVDALTADARAAGADRLAAIRAMI